MHQDFAEKHPRVQDMRAMPNDRAIEQPDQKFHSNAKEALFFFFIFFTEGVDVSGEKSAYFFNVTLFQRYRWWEGEYSKLY
jgi:hypothetical protein